MSQKEGVLTLTIKHVEEEDTDIYTCDVVTAKTMAKVTVKGKHLIPYIYIYIYNSLSWIAHYLNTFL